MIRRPGKKPMENIDVVARRPGRPPKNRTKIDATTNVECNKSFTQSCKRKSERLREKTRMVRHKSLLKQPNSKTYENNGDVTHRDSFVGISKGNNTKLFFLKKLKYRIM